MLLTNNLTYAVIAQEAPAPRSNQAPVQNPFGPWVMIGLLFLVFYFLIFRPQKKRQQKHAEFMTSLQRGDTVVTTGGIIGKIYGLSDRVVTLDLGNNQKIRVLRTAIASKTDIDSQDTKANS